MSEHSQRAAMLGTGVALAVLFVVLALVRVRGRPTPPAPSLVFAAIAGLLTYYIVSELE